MSTLQEYDFEAEIEALGRLEIGEPSRDQYGQRHYQTDGIEAADRLAEISRNIRRRLWSLPYREWARNLADQADRLSEQIVRREGCLYPGRLPRYFGGINFSGGRFSEIP